MWLKIISVLCILLFLCLTRRRAPGLEQKHRRRTADRCSLRHDLWRGRSLGRSRAYGMGALMYFVAHCEESSAPRGNTEKSLWLPVVTLLNEKFQALWRRKTRN
jgi:hypothetical protein